MTQPVERPTVEAERIVREFWGNPASQRVFPTPAAMNLMEAITAAIRAEREACAKVALEQRCERGTPWDRACTTIATAIRGMRGTER